MLEGKLKPGWKLWRFDQLATNVNVRIDNPSESGMEHYVGLEHLDPDSLRIRRWGSPDDVEATKLAFKTGDIIFGRRRAYQRKLGVAEFDGICSAHAMVLRARPEVVLPEFLPFFMQSDPFMNRAVEISVGSLSPTINWKTLASQEFALPSLEEQLRITQLLSEVVGVREHLLDVAKSSRSLLLSTLEKTWGGPSNARRTLGDIATHITSGSRGWAAHYSDDGKAIFLRITNVQRHTPRLDLSDLKMVNPPDTLEAARTKVIAGDILLSVTAELGLIGGISRDLGDAYVNQHLALVRVDSSVANSKYVAWYLCSPAGQRQIARFNDSGAKAGMNLKNVAALQIPWMESGNQDLIAAQLDEIESAQVQALAREKQMSDFQKSVSKDIFGGSDGV